MLGRTVQRSERHGEYLREILAARRRNKWSGEKRRRRTAIGSSVRSIGAHHANRKCFDRGVEHAKARPYAGLAGGAWNFGEPAVPGSVRRVGQSDAWSEIEIPWGPQSARNSRVG